MTEDVAWLLEHLWGPIVAVTAAHNGRANGLISSTVVTAGLLPESPRLSIQLSRANLTHDLVLAGRVFAVHLLSADEKGLEIVRKLGFHSGHEGSKLDGLSIRGGRMGAPVLDDAVAYAEARVTETFVAGAVSIVVADVMGGGRLRDLPVLTIDDVRTRMPETWLHEWERRRSAEIEAARRCHN